MQRAVEMRRILPFCLLSEGLIILRTNGISVKTQNNGGLNSTRFYA